MVIAFREERTIRDWCSVVASAIASLMIASLLPIVIAGGVVECRIMELLPGVMLSLRVDAFGLIFALTSSCLWVASSVYSVGYMRAHHGEHLTRFFAAFAIAISAALAVSMSGNLVTLFVFYEVLTISTYPLVVHSGTEEARRAGRKYLAYLLTAGVFLLFSVLLTQHLAGGTEFVQGGILSGRAPAALLQLLFLTFLIGFAKAAWMPLHSWLPSAMVAPTPVSALLHAVAVVKAGAFGIARVVCFTFGPSLVSEIGMGTVLMVIASVTIVVSSLLALAQDNLKRRLAYSTIGQLSYILLGVSLLNYEGIAGALVHIPFHAFMKITLFFAAGAILVTCGIERISEMKGIGRRMPVTMAAFSVGAIGVCGFPPVCGLFSKWYILEGAAAGAGLAVVVVILVSSLLNAAYFFPIIRTAFLDSSTGGETGYGEAPLLVLVPTVVTAIVSLAMGLYPGFPFLVLAEMASGAITGGA